MATTVRLVHCTNVGCFLFIILAYVLITMGLPSYHLLTSKAYLEQHYNLDDWLVSSSSSSRKQFMMKSSNDNSFELAYDESYGFFTDISDSQWRMHQEVARSEPLFFNVDNPEKGISENQVALWMLQNVDPIFNCPHMRRVGGRGDGPKWTCDPHRLASVTTTTTSSTKTSSTSSSKCLIYSVGSAGNYQWEDGMVGLLGTSACEIHVFDPDPAFDRPDENKNKNIHYHAWGIKASKGKQQQQHPANNNKKIKNFVFKTIPEILYELGHFKHRIDIFKIDCEGCEWTVLPEILERMDIRQLLIEIHPSRRYRPPGLAALPVSKFFQIIIHQYGFIPFQKEANTHPHAIPPGELFEYGFIKLKPSFLNRTTGE